MLTHSRQHIVRMLDCFVFRKHLCIAFELCGPQHARIAFNSRRSFLCEVEHEPLGVPKVEQVPPRGDAHDPDGHEAAAEGGRDLRAAAHMERETQRDLPSSWGGGRERGKVTQTHLGGGLRGSCHQEWDRCEGVLLADQHISPRN